MSNNDYERIARQQAIKHFVSYIELHNSRNKNKLSGYYSLRSLIRRLLRTSEQITTRSDKNTVSFEVISTSPFRIKLTSYSIF